jgi:Na+/H+ antiporter NhaC
LYDVYNPGNTYFFGRIYYFHFMITFCEEKEERMEAVESFGIVSLIPVVVVIIIAIISKRAVESLMIGTLVGAAILTAVKGLTLFSGIVDWWNTWFDFVLAQIGTSAIYIVMFGMFGTLIRLLDDSGAALGFAAIGSRIANTRKKTMIFSWVLGIIIFLSDFLTALGVGVAMRSLTDKWKVPREMLAYIVNSTGAAVCILVPISSWGVFYSTQLDNISGMDGMSGIAAYSHSIPFMFYPILAVLIVPLFSLGVIPLFGPMKKANARALETGKVFPEWHYEGESVDEMKSKVEPSGAWNFIVPIIVMVAVAILANITLAAIIASAVCFIMLQIQKRMRLRDLVDKVLHGFTDMQYVTILVIFAFVLQDINDALGLTPFVIEGVAPILSPALLPLIVFVVVSALAFSTGSFWGVAAISFPIVMPLALEMGVNPFLTIAAVSTATAFGSQACFYSDSVTVVAAATGIRNMDYAKNSLPLIGVPFGLAMIANLIAGIIMS